MTEEEKNEIREHLDSISSKLKFLHNKIVEKSEVDKETAQILNKMNEIIKKIDEGV